LCFAAGLASIDALNKDDLTRHERDRCQDGRRDSLRVAVRAYGPVSLMQKALKDDLVSEQFCTDTAQSAGLGCRRRLLQVRRTDISATRR
jgi:hypothetical protein